MFRMAGGIILYLYGKTPKSVIAPQSGNVGGEWEEENMLQSSGTSLQVYPRASDHGSTVVIGVSFVSTRRKVADGG
jgi:hypothetical protein